MGRLFFREANVIQADGGVQPDSTVVVEDERIVAVGNGAGSVPEPGDGDEVYRLNGKYLMPGMIAGHAHLSYLNAEPEDFRKLELSRSPVHMAVLAAKHAEATLKAGFTAACGAGSLHQIDRMLKDLIREGEILGPRLLACGMDIVPTGGGIDLMPTWWKLGMQGLPLRVDGPDEVRRAVRLQAKEGNDVIKIYPQGGHGVPMRGMDMQQDEIEAAVNTAHDKGKLVRAHVVTKRAIMACLDAGVDILDHCDHMDDEVIERVIKQNVFVLPSLYFLAEGYSDRSEERMAQVERWLERAAEVLPRAQAAGVKLVTGDDFGTKTAPHGDNAKELALYVERLGLSARDVIVWATTNAAEMMRKSEDFGRIKPGLLADLLVIDGNPIDDISLLTERDRLVVIMQGGKFITNTLRPN